MNSPETRPQLKKAISGLGFFALAFGSMIGVGWITALGGWFGNAGPGGAMIAFAGGGLLMLLIGLCYAELTPMFPVTGGEVAYAYKAFGTDKAFLVGWFLAFGYLSVSAFEAVSVGIVLTHLFPQLEFMPLYEIHGSQVHLSHLILAFLFTGFITWVNYRGVAVAMRLQILLTLLLLVCTGLFVFAGICYGDAGNLKPLVAGITSTDSWQGILAVFVTAPFWFVGFDTIPQAAEERASAGTVRRLGLYILLAIAGATLFYIVVMLAAGMANPWQATAAIPSQDLPTAVALQQALGSNALKNLVLSAGLIGLLTSWNGFFLAGTRVLFSLGRGRIIDPQFGQAHARHGTPTRAILFSGVVTALAACLGKGAIGAFIHVGSFCIAVAFLGVSLSLLTLRSKLPDELPGKGAIVRPYRLPAGRLVACLAATGSLLILLAMVVPSSPEVLVWPLEWLILLALCFCGTVFWGVGRQHRRETNEAERARLILGDKASPSQQINES